MSHAFPFFQYQLRQFQMTSKYNLGLSSNNLYTLATPTNGGQNEKYMRLVDSFVLTKVLSVYHSFFHFSLPIFICNYNYDSFSHYFF